MPSATWMAAAKHGYWKTAAPEMRRLQSTGISANVVFLNIDWKATRHGRTLNNNMKLLGKTIANVVQKMNPTMICMCEVGAATWPLTEEQMQQVLHQCIQAWKEAATEHFELQSMFEVGAPYMTIYKDGAIQCFHHRILTDVYNAKGLPRTAQTFLCRGPGDDMFDLINVHAPSPGKKKKKQLSTHPQAGILNDQQRMTLLTNLLQRDSKSMPGLTIGKARFLVGGDMNTSRESLSSLLQACRQNGSLHTQEQIHEPVFGHSGDLCFLGGFEGNTLTTTAENHDPRHKPYGIFWLMVQESATRQPWQDETRQQERSAQTRDGSATQQSAASSSGYATEQPLQIYTATDPAPKPPMPAQLKLENLKSGDQETLLTDSDMEDFHSSAPDEETSAATEHSQDPSTPQLASQELPADRGMIYAIVNEFLGKMTLNSPEAEDMLIAALKDESYLPHSMHLLFVEVFSPIFFYYPNGLDDRSVWKPRNTSQYIDEWHRLAAMRTQVTTDATATEHGKQLSKDQVSQIFKFYKQKMQNEPRPGQSNKKTNWKSCAEAKMNREAGHTFVANAIWAIGLPRLPLFATKRPDEQLSAQDLEAVPEAIRNVLNWLDRIASSHSQHRQTPEYQLALRKSGVTHGESGLTAAELETRTATRKAKFDMRTATALDKRWRAGSLTSSNWCPWQENLLRAFWDGSLQRQLQRQGSATEARR